MELIFKCLVKLGNGIGHYLSSGDFKFGVVCGAFTACACLWFFDKYIRHKHPQGDPLSDAERRHSIECAYSMIEETARLLTLNRKPENFISEKAYEIIAHIRYSVPKSCVRKMNKVFDLAIKTSIKDKDKASLIIMSVRDVLRGF